MDTGAIARLLIVMGLVILAGGVLLLVLGRIPGIGRLPGDIVIHRNGMTIFIPIVTMLLLSLLLSVALNIIFRLFR